MGAARWKYLTWKDRNPNECTCIECNSTQTVTRVGIKSTFDDVTLKRKMLIERFECSCGKSWSIETACEQ